MDKDLRKEVKLVITSLFTSNSSMTHTDDWRKMRMAAEMLQTLLSLVDELECSQGLALRDKEVPTAQCVGSSPTQPPFETWGESGITDGLSGGSTVAGSRPAAPPTQPEKKCKKKST